jgi:hypothetical protein
MEPTLCSGATPPPETDIFVSLWIVYKAHETSIKTTDFTLMIVSLVLSRLPLTLCNRVLAEKDQTSRDSVAGHARPDI